LDERIVLCMHTLSRISISMPVQSTPAASHVHIHSIKRKCLNYCWYSIWLVFRLNFDCRCIRHILRGIGTDAKILLAAYFFLVHSCFLVLSSWKTLSVWFSCEKPMEKFRIMRLSWRDESDRLRFANPNRKARSANGMRKWLGPKPAAGMTFLSHHRWTHTLSICNTVRLDSIDDGGSARMMWAFERLASLLILEAHPSPSFVSNPPHRFFSTTVYS
jgi:hypothetical protein